MLLLKKTLTYLSLLLLPTTIFSQETISLGKASYASHPPKHVEDSGIYGYTYKKLKEQYPFYIHANMKGQPVPTNDWWTDAIFSQYAGNMWAYPQGVSANNNGIKVIYPDGFDGGKLSTSNFLEVKGSTKGENSDFSPESAKPYNWGDLNMVFRCEDANNNHMDVSISHGSPFVWIEFNGIAPVLTPSDKATLYTKEGKQIESFPVTANAFIVEIGTQIYGVHLPAESIVDYSNGNYLINRPQEKQYLVISVLPTQKLLKTFDKYARNKIANTQFKYAYNVAEGLISTTFASETSNLETGACDGQTIMSFQPHHYRTSNTQLNFIDSANYITHKGIMRTAIANNFTFTYNFTGIPPHLGAPKNMSKIQAERLNQMVSNFKVSKFSTNTYNKVLDELSEMMLIAREINHPRFTYFKETLKAELTNWLTYDKANTNDYFFTRYPEYGALIGFPTGYDSQAFNDLHFHYGYYVLSAARLMMIDEDFKTDYAEMIKLIAKSFANWERWDGESEDQKFPFLRTFDPYCGHSWAGGTSDALGSNQESTSEAVMSWFGLFNLGLALNDSNLIALGATGYKLETEATLEYWLDIYEENFPESYEPKYVGILRAGELIHNTWFSNDPAWIFGIQCVPNAHYCSYLSPMPEIADKIWKSSIENRVKAGIINTNDIYSNLAHMESYLGSYHLGYYATYNPENALKIQDKLYENVGGEWQYQSQAVINYYLSNANITYGKPAKEYHTSLPGAAVYKNKEGNINYLIYNHTTNDKKVHIYKGADLIETVTVKAKEYYSKQ